MNVLRFNKSEAGACLNKYVWALEKFLTTFSSLMSNAMKLRIASKGRTILRVVCIAITLPVIMYIKIYSSPSALRRSGAQALSHSHYTQKETDKHTERDKGHARKEEKSKFSPSHTFFE